MKNTFRLTIFILLVLTSIQYSCSANKTRLARDDWAMIDTIGIIRIKCFTGRSASQRRTDQYY